jgi:hypothetical protein
MKHECDKLKNKGLTDDQFEAYLVNPNVRKLYTVDMLKELKSLWYGEEVVEVKVEKKPKEKTRSVSKIDYSLIQGYSKDQLDEYSINTWGVDLDKRFSKKKMIEELENKLKSK